MNINERGQILGGCSTESGEWHTDLLVLFNNRPVNNHLEDYAYLIESLLELYQTTFESRWFVAAQELAETMITHFEAPEGVQLTRTGQLPSDSARAGGIADFYDTSDDHETLITRPRDLQDNATPSGNAMAVTALLKLAGFTNELRYVDVAHQALAQMQPMMSQYPLGFGQWLAALSYALSRPREIVIIGKPEAPDTAALLGTAQDGYRPYQIVAVRAPDSEMILPAFQDRVQIGDRATAYVCDAPVPGRAFACQAAVADPDGLRALLGRKEVGSRASDEL